ncbi:MAG: EAL domain-containing protein, partial [Anaerotignum sp.]
SSLKQQSSAHYIDLPNGMKNKIRFSGGIAWYPDDSKDVKELLKISDFTMLEAKQAEKGSIYEFDKLRYKNRSYLLENSEAINRLIDDKLVRFAFQPIVDLKTGEIFAYEALMRPLTPEFNGPLEILSVASAQSKLPQLERLIMSVVCDTIAKQLDIIGDRYIFVNSIPAETADNTTYFLVKTIKEQYNNLFEKIIIEIIERDSRDENALIESVNYLKENGFKVAIDDFGSGYSNEIRIIKLSPNIVKIDMELIQGIATNVDKQVIVKGIIDFCHQKDIRIVAEGVEYAEDLKYLIDIHVDYVQGYYLAKPNFEFMDLPEDKKQEILNYNRNK